MQTMAPVFRIGIFFVFLIFLPSIRSYGTHISQCFVSLKPNPVQPLYVLRYTNQANCLKTCQLSQGNDETSRCASMIWDAHTSSCYIFNSTTAAYPTMLMNRYGTEYYEFHQGICGGIFPPPSVSEPSRPSTGGPSVVAPTSTLPPTVITPQVPVAPIDRSTTCRTNYFVVAGMELTILPESEPTIMNDVKDENACIAECTRKDACCSITALLANNACILSGVKSYPNGPAPLSAFDGAVYFEKLCLPSAPPSCSEKFFFLFPNKTFIQTTFLTLPTPNLMTCADQCAANHHCLAAVYDSDSSTCMLKRSTAVQHADSLVAQNGHYYFENGCQPSRTSWKHASDLILHDVIKREEKARKFNELKLIRKQEGWSSWSACRYEMNGIRYRVRTLNCSNPRKCPESNTEYQAYVCCNAKMENTCPLSL